ncbi:MAG TPA: ATP-binding protein [Streptosporangiaceae bacterium]
MSERGQSPVQPPAHAAAISYRGDLAKVRQFVRDQAAKTGLPANRIADLVIAVSELAANTLRHTQGYGTVHIWSSASEVVCQVRDGGHIADSSAGSVRPSSEAAHGHGLWVVRQLCDTIDISSGAGGTTIRLCMRLGY